MDIIPNVSVGPIKFSMDYTEVEKLLGKPSNAFKRTPNSKRLTVVYDEIGVMFEVETDLSIPFISAFKEANLYGLQLINMDIKQAVEKLAAIGHTFVEEESGFWDERSAGICLVESSGRVGSVDVRPVDRP